MPLNTSLTEKLPKLSERQQEKLEMSDDTDTESSSILIDDSESDGATINSHADTATTLENNRSFESDWASDGAPSTSPLHSEISSMPSQSELLSSSQPTSQESHAAMDTEPLEGQVFEVPLLNVVQEAVIVAQNDENVRNLRERTPLSCSQNDDVIKPLKSSTKKRKR